MNSKFTANILALLVISCAGAAPPWFEGGGSRRWPSEFYFVGVGSASDYNAAFDQAAAQIARQIEVTIESELTQTVESYTAADQETITSSFQAITRTVAKTGLQGVQVTEKTVEGGFHYVQCVLDKRAYLDGLKAELDRRRQTLEQQKTIAHQQTSEGRALDAVETLLATTEEAAQFEARLALWTALSRQNYPLGGLTLGPALLAEVRDILGRIRLEKLSGDKQSSSPGRLLPEPLAVQASLADKSGKTAPLANLKLKAKSSSFADTPRRWTDPRGVADFYITVVGKNPGTVVVSPDLSTVSPLVSTSLTNLAVTFDFTPLEKTGTKFSINIIDTYNQTLPVVEAAVAKSVNKAGFQVSDQGKFQLRGKMEVLDSKQVGGLAGPTQTVKTGMTLFLIDNSNGSVIGSLEATATGIDKNSPDKALEKAYQAVAIPASELAKLLGQAQPKTNLQALERSRKAFAQAQSAFEKGDYNLALEYLTQVGEDDELVSQAGELVKTINKKLETRPTTP